MQSVNQLSGSQGERESRRDVVIDLFDLTGRVAIVTGGTRGIGRAIAEAYSAMGASVVVASRKAEACMEAQDAINATGGQALGVPTHMGDVEAIRALVSTTVDRFGGLDIVVNNAANPLALPIESITEAAWEKAHSVNLKGPVFLAQAALPHLRASSHAVVINILSVGALTSSPFIAMYSGAKAAMLAYTRNMAAEWARDNIRVNAIAPGPVDTEMMRNNTPEAIERMRTINLQQRIASPSEMVGPALFLASDASSYVTGQMVVADGGFSVAR
jgi:NAD(P)-dependent dehydrogenase (short-subunit alcohol dehydrogenase family)